MFKVPSNCVSGQLIRPKASVTLEEVENVDDFVSKLDKLELPNQLVAVLEDPLLQKLLLLKPSGKTYPFIKSKMRKKVYSNRCGYCANQQLASSLSVRWAMFTGNARTR